MSKETLHHLNTNILIGNTDHRGHAWHYKADLQGEENNHYPGAIPVEDVVRRLFNWEAESRRVAVEVPADVATMTHLSEGGSPVRWVVMPERQAIARNDVVTGEVMGLFKDGYDMHQYKPWLLDEVATILDGDLGISSAGLLKGGAIAWVEISVPDSITTPEGVVFRPNLLTTTSFDGSISTTFKRTITDTVCDNTRECALGEKGQQYKVKHSRYSQLRIGEARQALAMVYTLADQFAAEVKTLVETPVSNKQWLQFVDLIVPTTKDGKKLEGRSLTNARNKSDALNKLYKLDPRVAPWTGTAHGVLQAVNTWEHHGNRVTGDRGERNMLLTVEGRFGEIDRGSWSTLNKVLVTA